MEERSKREEDGGKEVREKGWKKEVIGKRMEERIEWEEERGTK